MADTGQHTQHCRNEVRTTLRWSRENSSRAPRYRLNVGGDQFQYKDVGMTPHGLLQSRSWGSSGWLRRPGFSPSPTQAGDLSHIPHNDSVAQKQKTEEPQKVFLKSRQGYHFPRRYGKGDSVGSVCAEPIKRSLHKHPCAY